VYWARNVPELLMSDASDQNELLLQYLSTSETARSIDGEVGDLAEDLLGGKPHLTYVRYNSELDKASLAEVGITVTQGELSSLREMSVGANAGRLLGIGQAFAKKYVKSSHFPSAFDLP
jgi:uncharacterized protein